MGNSVSTAVTIHLPNQVIQRMERVAQQRRRSIADMVRDLVLEQWLELPLLPDEIETELEAFTNLSDDVLWLLARSTLTAAEREELAQLNQVSKAQPLTATEDRQREALLEAYGRTMVRRAHAAMLLQSRGYNLADPSGWHPPASIYSS